MAISGRIVAVTVHIASNCKRCGGTGKDENGWDTCSDCHGGTAKKPVVRVHLEQIGKGQTTGQPALTVINPPKSDDEIIQWVGMEIWSVGDMVMTQDSRWATRIGYTKIELMGDSENEHD